MSSSKSPPFGNHAVAIRTVDLARSYGADLAIVHALCGVSIEVRHGERVALLGKSGSGKSTLLNVLGGLDRPSSGSVEIEGHDLARMNADELARHRLATVGIIFQSFHLIPSRTALENVALPMVFAGRPAGQRRDAAQRALEAVGLGQRQRHRPAELSGGERQRVAIARALVNDPAVLLADEPTGNLDSATAAEIIALIDSYVRRHGTTLVLVTHDEELARGCTDRLLRLRDGQLVL
jgi:predicted ABC-type transport system involved in lysophospholipase L1 biosynthesis ATPase subunit